MPGCDDIRFSAKKSPQSYRIFCVGSSAAQGWPHPQAVSFPAFLRRKLHRLAPSQEMEVLNVCAHAYASYRIKLICDEVAGYDPDLLVIWAGNNEFHEEARYERESERLPGMRLRRVIDGTKGQLTSPHLFWAFGRASEERLDHERYQTVRDHYSYNLEQMVEAGRGAGAQVVLCTVPVNLREWRPNSSAHSPDLGPADLARWRQRYAHGFGALEEKQFARAEADLREASAMDPSYAEVWFDLGQALAGLGRTDDARAAFENALRLDAFPFRSHFNDIVHDVGARLGVTVVDLASTFAQEAGGAIPGYDLFVDYCHPTPQGNELAAAAVARALCDRGILPGMTRAPEDDLREGVEYAPPPREWTTLQLMLIRLIATMRQWDRVAALAQELLGREAELRRDVPNAELDEWITTLRARLDIWNTYARFERATKLNMAGEQFSDDERETLFSAYAHLVGSIMSVEPNDLTRFFPKVEYWSR